MCMCVCMYTCIYEHVSACVVCVCVHVCIVLYVRVCVCVWSVHTLLMRVRYACVHAVMCVCMFVHVCKFMKFKHAICRPCIASLPERRARHVGGINHSAWNRNAKACTQTPMYICVLDKRKKCKETIDVWDIHATNFLILKNCCWYVYAFAQTRVVTCEVAVSMWLMAGGDFPLKKSNILNGRQLSTPKKYSALYYKKVAVWDTNFSRYIPGHRRIWKRRP